MYKLTKVSAVLTGILLSQVSLANDVCSQRASTLVCGSGDVTSIENTGAVRLKGTQVVGQTNVTGSFKAESARLNKTNITGSTDLSYTEVNDSLHITGSTKSSDSIYHGEFFVTGKLASLGDHYDQAVTVIGDMSAEASEYLADLTVTSREVSLVNVKASNINIKQSGSTNPKQSIFIRDGSKIIGNITFEGGNGMVMLANGSEITGDVIGAEIYQGG